MIREVLELDVRTRKKESQPVDTAGYDQMLKRAKTAPKLQLSGEHNLFNPVV